MLVLLLAIGMFLYCVETATQIKLFFAYRFPVTYATLSFREIQKIRVFPSGTLPQTLAIEYFATAHLPSSSVI